MSRKRLIVADLFCGAGGTSTGITQFCESIGQKLDIVAVNHWERAVETHAANHPSAHHFCQDLTRLKPSEAVPGGKLDLLVASPECTHHSNARGGKPKSDQSRASAWVILEWVNALKVDRVIIENVPEFQSWGPLGADGKALRSKRGETFNAFVKALESSGYRVGYKVLNSADYGAATARRRLFIQAVKGRREIRWPDHTHTRHTEVGLLAPLPKWRAAREIIDFRQRSQSIFGRKRPLSKNTLNRIAEGIRMFCGKHAEPFLVLLRGTKSDQINSTAKPLNQPVPTITANGEHVGLTHGGRILDINEPLPTVTTAKRGEIGIVEPFYVPYYGTSGPASVNDPLATVTTKDRFALVEPKPANLDIHFRMLQPNELSAAMGFPSTYKITGNKSEQVKQIGNAVEVNQARALAGATLGVPA